MSQRVENEMYKMSDVLADIDYFSKYFSEGNSYLESCLKLLWKLKYKTIGCCTGHDKKELYPYIMLATLDKVENQKLLYLAEKLRTSVAEIKTMSYIKNNNYVVILSSADVDNKLFISLKYHLEKELEKMEEIKFEFTGILKDASEGGSYRRLPERSTKKSAGYDFYNPEKVEIEPHTLKLVKTGIKAKFPDDYTLKLYNRSSNPKKKGVFLANGVGVVDADYYGNPDNDGEIGFMFYNFTNEVQTFEAGDKLGQGIFERYFTTTDEGEITAERTGGFGSTGK